VDTAQNDYTGTAQSKLNNKIKTETETMANMWNDKEKNRTQQEKLATFTSIGKCKRASTK